MGHFVLCGLFLAQPASDMQQKRKGCQFLPVLFAILHSCNMTKIDYGIEGVRKGLTGVVKWLTGIVKWLAAVVKWLAAVVKWLTGVVK